ncbi:MAG: hypothetical protein IIA67_03095 [Planctomycetes bacterium]|nr:hypothetical protein [Planctomycetota bacterium]
MIPADDQFNRSRLRRGQNIVVDQAGHQARFASPEDTILKKLEYYREGGSEKHVRDIKGVLMIQGDGPSAQELPRLLVETDPARRPTAKLSHQPHVPAE